MNSTRKKVGEKYCDWLPHLTYCYTYYDGLQCFKLLIYFGNSIQYILFNCWNRNAPFMDETGSDIDFTKSNWYEQLMGSILDIDKTGVDCYNKTSILDTRYFGLDFKSTGHLDTINGEKYVRINNYTCILELARQHELEKRKKMLTFMKCFLPKEKPLPKDFYACLRKLLLFSSEESNEMYTHEYKKWMIPIVKKICLYLKNVETVNLKRLRDKSNKILDMLEECKEVEIMNSLIKDIFSYEKYEKGMSNLKQHLIFSMSYDVCIYIMQSIISKNYNVLISEFLFDDTDCKYQKEVEYFAWYPYESPDEDICDYED